VRRPRWRRPRLRRPLLRRAGAGGRANGSLAEHGREPGRRPAGRVLASREPTLAAGETTLAAGKASLTVNEATLTVNQATLAGREAARWWLLARKLAECWLFVIGVGRDEVVPHGPRADGGGPGGRPVCLTRGWAGPRGPVLFVIRQGRSPQPR
jgi:hypothetical protein